MNLSLDSIAVRSVAAKRARTSRHASSIAFRSWLEHRGCGRLAEAAARRWRRAPGSCAQLPRNYPGGLHGALFFARERRHRRRGDLFFAAQLPGGAHRALFFTKDSVPGSWVVASFLLKEKDSLFFFKKMQLPNYPAQILCKK